MNGQRSAPVSGFSAGLYHRFPRCAARGEVPHLRRTCLMMREAVSNREFRIYKLSFLGSQKLEHVDVVQPKVVTYVR